MGDSTTQRSMQPAPAAAEVEAFYRDLLNRIFGLGPMRRESMFQLEQWVTSAELGHGGTLMLQAPHRLSKRSISEANYIGERAGYFALPR